MTHEIGVTRNHGHPWDGRPGFDLLEYCCQTQEESLAIVSSAEAKFWHPWLVHGLCESGEFPVGGVMYKPCDIESPWEDSPDAPHPGIVRT